MKPYTYLLKHIPTNTYYYGVRYQNVKKKIPIAEDLWTKYFTSSTKVKNLITKYGTDSFEFEIRKVFETPRKATDWETKVLRRCKVLHDDRWINANIAGKIIPSIESNKKISDIRLNKSAAEKAAIYNKMRNTVKNKTKQESMITSARLSVAVTKIHATRPAAEKERLIQKQKATYHSKSAAEKAKSGKGLRWYTNGTTANRYIAGEQPAGFILGRKLHDDN